ncbi:MAG TPA: GNAT family N-acetyltransferase [Chitinophagaceae bacterium]|nr:GNAT family N-acetyltransferase [Chitinophagaceae bacterium]
MLRWTCTFFPDLNVYELYAILRLRSEVFVVEQNCVFLDMDNKDLESYHVCGWKDEELVAYTRLVPAGLAYNEASIGRVITALTARGTGAGRELMQVSIRELHKLWGVQPIRIGAQLYLRKFYESLGFRQTSEIYLEDGIEHIEMIFPILEA